MAAALVDTAEPKGLPPSPEDRPERVLAIMHTSGTTGPPKGVMLTERMLGAAARSAARVADVQPDDVLFLWEPLYHIAGLQAIALCLEHGVPCALVERFSASAFWDQVRRYRATQVHYLGGVFSILMKQAPRPDDRQHSARIAWGAAAPPGLWRAFEERFGVQVRECYGLTEGASFTTVNTEGKVGSIGRPVDHFEVAIVDENDGPLGELQVGEIIQRGREPGLIMDGYFNDPAASADALRGGWLHTGDLGYRDHEGFFYYAGRKKDSIRTRGENVSAWEVEQVAVSYPGVAQCAVIGVPSETGESDLKLFVKAGRGAHIDPLDLVRWCDRQLAYFQVPRYVSFIDEFPVTPSQRIRKDALSRDVSDSWDLAKSGYRPGRKDSA
jgi:crotonobetaine/carnitine-CoA ligase